MSWAWLTNDSPTMSAHSAANRRASWLWDPSRSMSSSASGRLIPFAARSLEPFGSACGDSKLDRIAIADSTMAPSLPSSSQT